MYYEIYWRSANGERGHVTQGDCKVPKRKEREPLRSSTSGVLKRPSNFMDLR